MLQQRKTFTYILYIYIICECDDSSLFSPSHYLLIALLSGQPVSWQDGSALAYSKWKSEALVAGKKSEPRCAVMMTGGEGTWKLVNCKATYSRVVCQTEASEYHKCIEGIV